MIGLFLGGDLSETIATSIIKKMEVDFLPTQVNLLHVDWFAPLEVYVFRFPSAWTNTQSTDYHV